MLLGGIQKAHGQAGCRNRAHAVIYYWARAHEILLMLLIYGKNEQDDLTPDQLRTLKSLVEQEFK